MHIAFAVAHHQAAVIQCRCCQQTVQQIALRPQRHATFGAQRQQTVVLIHHINTVAVDDEIVHGTQLTFPHDLAATQVQRRQVAVVRQRVNHTVNDDWRGVHVTQTVNFS